MVKAGCSKAELDQKLPGNRQNPRKQLFYAHRQSVFAKCGFPAAPKATCSNTWMAAVGTTQPRFAYRMAAANAQRLVGIPQQSAAV